MLWTLHNRASESLRPDAMLRDPEAERIYRAIPYDYRQSFGPADSSHAVRSLMFDEAVAAWMQAHPGGSVVELGCGLETQFQRIDDGRVRWLCVDVPEAIEVRERFLPAGERCRHVRCSALDPAWMDEIPAGEVFVTAQGLLMYFDESTVRGLTVALVERFPGVEFMFDTIPVWFSRKTVQGYWRTPHYKAPPMPWGIALHDAPATLRGWSPAIEEVRAMPYRNFRVGPGRYMSVFARIPMLRAFMPGIVRLRSRSSAR
ncbi:class I SAM-dependent methyltransferase [Pseudothauera rhizosphaerae]|uniref:Class I SAM-dependent methyltransferase n=1 Tax=Pseudothauera rhizosphaerae TaxID=2565932 RepID=A0A4S4AIG0_9RHOO|nr:class I SAM-dependent methyltransferase [Pseudothauera rhizosphaerae]THF58626.1 class I SAM-dependent methyltransferase [Pseudothauera rhizosphaerae]